MSVDWMLSLAAVIADSGDSVAAAIEWGLPIAIALLLLGFGLIFAEIFIPSGGALSIMAAIVLVTSIVAAFFDGVTVGLIFLVGVLVLTPMVIVIVFKLVFPHTAIGRRMINRGDTSSETQRRAVAHEEKTLLGHVGVTVTPLHPGGRADIAGEWRDVVTQNGESVDVGQSVQVTDVSGNRIVVRPVDTSQKHG